MENIISLFEKETRLKLRERYDSDGYYECSGISYRNILIKITDFNYKHNTHVYAVDDNIKDVTTIYFGR